MPRQPIGERAMTDAERQRKRRARMLHEAANDHDQRERLWHAMLAAKQRYDTLSKAVGGETDDQKRTAEPRRALYGGGQAGLGRGSPRPQCRGL